jgi:hypothetical protein
LSESLIPCTRNRQIIFTPHSFYVHKWPSTFFFTYNLINLYCFKERVLYTHFFNVHEWSFTVIL